MRYSEKKCKSIPTFIRKFRLQFDRRSFKSVLNFDGVIMEGIATGTQYYHINRRSVSQDIKIG